MFSYNDLIKLLTMELQRLNEIHRDRSDEELRMWAWDIVTTPRVIDTEIRVLLYSNFN